MKWLLRTILILVVFYTTFSFSTFYTDNLVYSYIVASLAALVCLSIIFIQEKRGFRHSAATYCGASVGAIAGLVCGNLMGLGCLGLSGGLYLLILLNAVFGYLGYASGMAKGDEFGRLFIHKKTTPGDKDRKKILDTSVIIDGRISDICDAGFIEGDLIVPFFILNELQHIADSEDSLKRIRGRRGLDILNRLKKNPSVTIDITHQDFPRIAEVDSKLIALAKEMDAPILTTDFNLNKVAQIQGIVALNVNQLSEAIKPSVLPGECIHVTISRQGKERQQGVAYLDDGTMVVVEDARYNINKTIHVEVTSILQTPAGRMIFATPHK